MIFLEIDLLPQWLDDFLHPKSDFTHGHFIMDVVIVSFFVLIYSFLMYKTTRRVLNHG